MGYFVIKMLPIFLKSRTLPPKTMQKYRNVLEMCRTVQSQILTKQFHVTISNNDNAHGFSDENLVLSVREAITRNELSNQNICINGWVKSLRKMGKKTTFIDVVDGLSSDRIQIVANTKSIPQNISFHSAVSVVGNIVKSNHQGQEVELHASSVSLVNPTQLNYTIESQSVGDFKKDDENGIEKHVVNDTYPFAPRKRYPEDFCRMFPEFRSKLADFGNVLRLRSTTTHAINQFFHERNFIQIHTPILTGNDCEGAGEVFTVQPASDSISTIRIKEENEKAQLINDDLMKEKYFGKDVYLTVSGQLHLEAICNGISRVYNFSPVFRAEHGKSRRHLSEFWMVEAEVGFAYDIKQDVALLIESLVKHVLCSVLESSHKEIEIFAKLSHENDLSKNTTNFELLEMIADINKPFIIMTYDEALEILSKNSHIFQSKPIYGEGLGNEHELYLVEKHCSNIPVHIVEWPKSTKPFYTRLENTEIANAVDTLFPKVGELCGGALREHREDILLDRMKECGLYNDKNLEAMQWYLNLRRIGGASPTGGFGLGFDRLIQLMLGINNIRDTMPFPRTPHKCRL